MASPRRLDGNGLPDFAERFNRLIEIAATVEGGRLVTFTSNQQVADSLQAVGLTIGEAYVGRLRKDPAANPSARIVAGVCLAFSVSADYFFGTPSKYRQIESALLDRRATRVQRVAALALSSSRGVATR